MTPDVVAVLVVPAPGDPGGLLAPGACGARPPLVRRWDTARGPWWGRHYCPEGSVVTDDYGLPLWWDGCLVPEGWDRLRRRLRAAWPGREMWPAHMPDDPTRDMVAGYAIRIPDQLVSRVVLLTRVDGRLVELEPVGVGR